MKVRKVILSRSRAEHITTHKILEEFTLVVPESEIPEYEKRVKTATEIVGIPDDIHGLGAVRNWVLDRFDEEILIMLDDDIRQFILLLGQSPQIIKRPELIEQILLNCAVMCLDAGLTLFSFSQKGDVRKYQHTEPFKLNSWVGTIVGIIGREHRFTEQNKLKVDADYTLQVLRDKRIVWIDERYVFTCHRDNNSGGNGLYRTQELIDQENEFLKRKWGQYIRIRKQKEKYGLSLGVTRKQSIVV